MPPLVLGLLFGLIGASGVIIGALLVLRLTQVHRHVIPVLLGFAAGTLLGAAFLALIPEAASVMPLRSASALALLGVIAFFLLEKSVLWRHCHDPECEQHKVAGYLILVGDGIHNAVDGLVLGAAFVADTALGVTVGIAVLAHEVPQEVGDFVLLLEAGLSSHRALAYNLLSAATILPGIVTGFLVVEAVEPVAGVALAFAAGAFLYVALADLIPDLHRRRGIDTFRYQLVPLLVGIAVIWLAGQIDR